VSEPTRRILYWTPRVLCIAYALFLGLFSLDVFSKGLGTWQTLSTVAIHNIPSLLIVTILVAVWRREWIGTILFAAAGLAYIAWTMQHTNLALAIKLNWIVFVAGPMFVIAALFLANWMKRAQLHART
jgi:hypothetical protein